MMNTLVKEKVEAVNAKEEAEKENEMLKNELEQVKEEQKAVEKKLEQLMKEQGTGEDWILVTGKVTE